LALLLMRVLERKLRAAGLGLSAEQALEVLHTVSVVDTALGEGKAKRSLSRGSARARSDPPRSRHRRSQASRSPTQRGGSPCVL